MTNLPVAVYGNRADAKVALTFDDGPNPSATLRILDILDSTNTKATFFVLGKRCHEYPELLKEISRRGHLVGNHTYAHDKGDFKRCDDEVFKVLQKHMDFVRPPFYDVSFCIDESDYLLGKVVVTGDVDSKDYLGISPDEVVNNVISATQNGSIIDLHDGSETDTGLTNRAEKTISALLEIISELSKNYSLVRVDQIDMQFENKGLS